MASGAEVPEHQQISSLFERLLRRRDLSLFLPIVLGLNNVPPRETTLTVDNPDEETAQTRSASSTHDRIILINPFTQGMVVIEGGSSSLDTLLRDLAGNSGQPPASRLSIEAMPSVEIDEGEDREGECVVCLEEWQVGGVVKVMPCKHRFHPDCIEKWLGIHGSCPVCRYKMPVEEEELGKKRDETDEGEEGSRLGREIWVSFSYNGHRISGGEGNQGQAASPASPSSDVDDTTSSPAFGGQMEG